MRFEGEDFMFEVTNDEDNLEAINDLSEDMRQEIDTIYQAIAALSVKSTEQEQPARQKNRF